jgi:basic membrane lipoprotein Med (substrate-binding protein (PBP1-ABC) superfamily)
MSRFLVLSLIAASLSTIVGCGASTRASHTATPTNAIVAESRDDASWTPPDELALSIRESAATEATERSSVKSSSSFRPNRQDRPSRGAIRAATY